MEKENVQEAQSGSVEQTVQEADDHGQSSTRRRIGPLRLFTIWLFIVICYVPIRNQWQSVSVEFDFYAAGISIIGYAMASSNMFMAIAIMALLAVLYHSYFFAMTPVLLKWSGVDLSVGWFFRFIFAFLLLFTLIAGTVEYLLPEFYIPGTVGRYGYWVFVQVMVLRIIVVVLSLGIALRGTLQISAARAFRISAACVGTHLYFYIVYSILLFI